MKIFQTINNYCLYILVFSITFENWDPFKLVGSYSVTFLTSILYIGTSLPLFQKNFNPEIFKKYVVPLFFFILIGFISTAFNEVVLSQFNQAYNYRVVLLIVLMMLMATHISSDPKLVNRVLYTYVASMLLVYILFTLGVGESYEKGRLLFFGENPNVFGMKAVIAFLIVAAGALDRSFSVKHLVITIVLGVPLVILALLSVSRGAFLSIFLGFAVLVLFQNMAIVKKAGLIILGSLGSVFFFVYALGTNAELQRRMMNTIEKGDTGRNHLWSGALDAIVDNIFIGVGFTGVLTEMQKYTGAFMDTHNVFLYVLLSTGILGFVFFMKFIWNVSRAQYIVYRITGKTIYVVILVIMIFNMAKSGGAIGKILFWFLFAVLIAANITTINEKNKITPSS